jgi:serine phosphatase RsbU (regulator of sigma subunit)
MVVEMQTRYETVKKEKEIEKLKIEQEQKRLALERGTLIRNYSIGLAILGGFLVIVLLRGNRNKKRSNEILSLQRDELDRQKKLIEEKNKEISESIEYAKYIQDATLPSLSIQDLIKQSFLIYIPKDIVSGDFYWFEKDERAVYLVAADCTGHGVPGAFMSMIGTMLLNEIFNEKKVREPHRMLMELNRLLKMSLKQTDESVHNRNGMDIIICRLEISSQTLEFSSANRPLWLYRNEGKSIESFKANKAPIGGTTPSDFAFTSNKISLSHGDCFYLFSDGYADQFGGKNGKKMMTGKFKDMLLGIQDLTMMEQEIQIKNEFFKWKGEHQQVDDVLVMGVRVGFFD